MKCTSKKLYLNFILTFVMTLSLCGCADTPYDIAYVSDANISTFNVIENNSHKINHTFADDICVITEDIISDTVSEYPSKSALLCDVNDREVLYAKNVHDKVYPASITKVMTALVALKHGSMDQILTASNAVVIHEAGAQLSGLNPGDSMTLNQALHIMLLYSANDVALLIAENIGGSVDGFLKMMNEEAQALGATHTNFSNPHGLSDADNYSTAYDLYLIFNEATKFEKFNEIIQMTSYKTSYTDKKGKNKDISVKTTNKFLKGTKECPENITVIGGKTGVTNAAGHCLILLARDTAGAPYIAVVLGQKTSDELYEEMSDLLEEINK